MSTTKKTNEAAYERIAVPDFDSGKDAVFGSGRCTLCRVA